MIKTDGSIAVNKRVAKLLPNNTMSRRAITNHYTNALLRDDEEFNNSKLFHLYTRYKVGDVLWIREPAKVVKQDECGTTVKYADNKIKFVMISREFCDKDWFNKCQGVPNGCLKEMARYFIKVKSVRIERLQDISDEDILKEGWHIGADKDDCMLDWFIEIWNSTAKDGFSWEDNPFVEVIEWEYLSEKQLNDIEKV